MPVDLGLMDIAALMWFIFCWVGIYWLGRYFQDNDKPTLTKISKGYRNQWMFYALRRENKITDASLLNSMMRNVAFFASSCLLIMASLIAVLSTAERAISVLSDIPFAVHTSPALWKVKLILMLLIFVYAFYKIVWSLRHFNSVAVMLGAAPDNLSEEEHLGYAKSLGQVLHRALRHFNEGMRGFEYSLAVLAWFINPWLFMLSTTVVALIMYRREFASRIMRSMDASS